MLRLLARSLVHKHADPTGVIHRRHLGAKTGRSRVIVGANVFAGAADPGTRGVARGSVWGVTCPTTTGAAGFGSQSEGSVMRTRWLVAGVLAAVCSVALAACNDGEATPTETTSTQSPTATGASSSSTPTPTKSLTPEQQDLQDAEQSIVNYWKVLDEAAANPKSDLKALATVARAQALAQWQSTLSDYRSKGWVQHGNASVVDPVASKKAGKSFAVTACIDVSALDVVDKSGTSVVVPGRPQRQRYSYQVEKAPQGFFVTVDTLKAEPCGA